MKAVIDKKLRDYMENKKLKNIVYSKKRATPEAAPTRIYQQGLLMRKKKRS